MKYGIVSIVTIGMLWGALAAAQEPKQVSVAVKIVEFQTMKGEETGFSAYFKQRMVPQPYGMAARGAGNLVNADITFPNTTTAGITVFLDRISNMYGNIEAVLQALVEQNRAFILSRPKALVPVGAAAPTIIQTTQEVPYENTVVVGATAVQTTSFRPTGVTLEVSAPEIADDDGNPETTEDVYIKLNLRAEVNEEGQRLTIALDDKVAVATNVKNAAITVPEFISRSVKTTVWVKNGQVLVLGGLYRNTKNKTLATLPWLLQGEDFVSGLVQRATPLPAPNVGLSSALGNRNRNEGRRELVFLIKADLWRPAYTVGAEELDSDNTQEKPKKKLSPTGVISGVLGEIADIPRGIAEGLKSDKSKDGVTSTLGSEDD
jgi:hypothetical protein